MSKSETLKRLGFALCLLAGMGALLWAFWGQVLFYVVILIFVLVLWSIYGELGSPRNWWMMFTGHEINLIQTDYAEFFAKHSPAYQDDLSELDREIASWVAEMTTGPYFRTHHYRYVFFRARDAALFKLTWM